MSIKVKKKARKLGTNPAKDLKPEDIKIAIIDHGASHGGCRRQLSYEVVSPDAERADKAAIRLRFFMDMILRMMAGMEPPTNEEIPPEVGLAFNPAAAPTDSPKSLDDIIKDVGGNAPAPSGLILPAHLAR